MDYFFERTTQFWVAAVKVNHDAVRPADIKYKAY